MRILQGFVKRVRSLFFREQAERELNEELRFHLERQIEVNREAGMTPEEARRAALRDFGGEAQVREACREARGWRPLEDFLRDLRYGLRLMLRSPGFSLLAVLILAVGIGGTTAVFSLLYTSVLRPLPYPEPDRLMSLQGSVSVPERGEMTMGWSYPKFEDLRRLNNAFEPLAGFYPWHFNLTGAGDPERVSGEMVTGGYFEVLGVDPAAGRLFVPEEEQAPGEHPVVLISEGLWQRRFGARSESLGSTIQLNRRPYTVVGVLPQWFHGESGEAEIWTPVMMAPVIMSNPTRLQQRMAHWLAAVGRVRPGLTPEQAAADWKSTVARMEAEQPSPGDGAWGGLAVPLLEAKTDPAVRRSLTILLGAVAFVLLMACLNVANMLLGRALARRQELAVRLAIGAGRGTLLRQFLTESLLLACLAGAGGLVLARWSLDLLYLVQPQGLKTYRGWGSEAPFVRALQVGDASLETAVLLFGVLLTVSTILVFGLWPAWRACRVQPFESIKGGAVEGAALRFRLGGRAALVVSQVGLAFLLLTGAGLMLRSFAGLLKTPLGFQPAGLLTFRLDLPEPHYPGRAGREFYDRLSERLAALPGVESVAVTSTLPLRGQNEITIGSVDEHVNTGDIAVHMVDPSFFESFRVPLLRGRLLEPQDREGTLHVALVNETAARRLWPGENPIGRRLSLGLNGWYEAPDTAEIVGVVGDVKYQRVESPIGADVYLSSQQRSYPSNYVALRTLGEPEELVPAIRRVIRNLDPALPLYDLATGDQIVAEATSGQRFSSTLLTLFSLLALLLAGAGVYAVVSFAAAARTREIGVRLALGAAPARVVRFVMRDAALLCLAGLAAGAAASLAAMPVLAGLLHGVQATDATAFALSASVLLGVTLLACYVPARRASRIDPLVALRYE